MPIIIISSDGVNENVRDFKSMGIEVDILVQDHTPSCQPLADRIAKEITIKDTMVTNIFDGPDGMTVAINMIRRMNVQVGMIITRDCVLGYTPEWTAVSMHE